ncbi:putative helix-turn-helix domain-containing protein [Streptomyces sp. Tu6071]|nr:putative helix-turn-helix domain-containing protein [Streptomyces sp. Tu6071]
MDGTSGQGQFKVPEGQLQAFEVRMLQPFGAFVTDADVMTGPHVAEVGASRGRFPDQLAQGPVLGFTSGFGAEHSDRGPRAVRPVDRGVPGAGVEEEVTGEVGASPLAGAAAREQRPPPRRSPRAPPRSCPST